MTRYSVFKPLFSETRELTPSRWDETRGRMMGGLPVCEVELVEQGTIGEFGSPDEAIKAAKAAGFRAPIVGPSHVAVRKAALNPMFAFPYGRRQRS